MNFLARGTERRQVSTIDKMKKRQKIGGSCQESRPDVFFPPKKRQKIGGSCQESRPDVFFPPYDYFPTGDLRKTWGSRTTPVEYTYDAQGRMKTMRTWKEFDQSSGSGTSGSATTTWNYHPQRGFLTSKVYPDSQIVSYTYDAAGRIQTRTWARGVVTTYGYNNAGDLASVTYSDGTTPVTLAWNRVGQKETASDDTGDREWWYDFYGRIEYDAFIGENDTWSWIAYDYDGLGRLLMKDIQPLSGSSWRYSYSYDDAGRLHRVTYNDQDPAPRAAEYDYNSATGRIHDIHFLEGEDTVVSTRKVWDGLGRQTDAYGYNSTMIVQARRSHEYNDANQITRTIDEKNSYWDYGYDDLGQVTSGQKFLWNGIALDGHDLGYSYDAIGNRTTTVTNGRSATWTEWH